MKKYLYVFGILLVIIILLSFIVINIISKKISPGLFKYAEAETKKFSNLIINSAVSKTITDKLDVKDIFIIDSNNGEIVSIDFNTPLINYYLTEATKCIQEDIENIEKGNVNNINSEVKKKYNRKDLEKGIIYTLNTGLISGSPLLANLGPKIPIKINLVGDVISYISADVDDYGINNSAIRVFVNFKVDQQVILPLYKKNISMGAKIPIAVKLITGKLPQYYLGTKEGRQIVIPS